jgi:ABC-type polysaccharide/polyol phosphate transport system ATPase subunit
MDSYVIEMRHVGIAYARVGASTKSLKEWLIKWVKGHRGIEKIDALSDLSVNISPGQRVGIIGRNGSGKSTMLKVLSQIIRPTTGEIICRGRVTAMLELGAGFHPDFSGIENIYLNASLMGKSLREIKDRLEYIVDFTGLKDRIYEPVRVYSSGMLARLAFATSTAWRTDVLIIDEVLAVGDVEFQRACDQRIKWLTANQATVLIASHDLNYINTSCDFVLWLDQGQLRMAGPPQSVIGEYMKAVG